MDGKVGGERRVAAAGSAKSISQNIVGGNGKTRYARVFYDSFSLFSGAKFRYLLYGSYQFNSVEMVQLCEASV